MADTKQIVRRITGGEIQATDDLLRIVYNELRELASRRLAREKPGQSWQTTELVHEAYLRLVGSDQSWDGKGHFFAAAAEAMRRLLVERARKRQRQKHGGGRRQLELQDLATFDGMKPDEVVMIDDLFDSFAAEHPVEAEVARLRYFAGFKLEEIAQTLNISVTTAHRYWSFAKAWFRVALGEQENTA